MKLVDAAIWAIEVGDDAARNESRGAPVMGPFNPAFETRPWMRKGKLRVVDRQKATGKNTAKWIVLQDTEDEGVYLLLTIRKRTFHADEMSVQRVVPLKMEIQPDTTIDPTQWQVEGPIDSPRDLLVAMRVSFGSGRRLKEF